MVKRNEEKPHSRNMDAKRGGKKPKTRSSLIWGKMTGQMKERKEEISRVSPMCMKEGSMEPKWKTFILV